MNIDLRGGLTAWSKLAIVSVMVIMTVLAYLFLQALFPFIISMRDYGISSTAQYSGNFSTFAPALRMLPLWMFLAPCFCELVAIAMLLKLPENVPISVD